MGLTIPLSSSRTNGDDPPIHWPTAKAEVIAQLDIIHEYEKLGVKFPNYQRGGKDQCWVACHAVGREDNVASAAIHCEQGIYVDKGLEKKSLDFFKFVAEYGPHGSWYAGWKHYADQVGYKSGRVEFGSGGSILEARHEYRDADGNRSYACYRYRLPNGSKKPSLARWDNGRYVRERGCMEGVEPLPYRFPDLLGGYASQDFILWVEGEADADRAHDAGFVATTSHMGSGNFQNTGAKFLHLLPAHDYAVVPDNDAEGRSYAAEVADALKGHFGSEATVKVVLLPEVPYGGNVSDWLGVFGTAEELRALIAAAPAWEPGSKVEPPEAPKAPEPTDDEREALIVTLEDVANYVSEAMWVWDGWISAEALTLVAAEPGIGKTLFMMDLHRRALKGLDWPDGRPMNLPPGRRTLWVPADNHYKQLLKVADSFGIPRHRIAVNATKKTEPLAGRTLMTDEDLADLERNIRLVQPYWVVIDTITQTGEYKSQDTVDAKRQYTPLQEMALRTGVPIVCVTHLNAGRTVIGRRAVEKVRTVVMLSRPDRDDQPHRRKLWVDKTWDVEPPPLGVTVGEAGYEYDTDPPEEPEKAEGKFSMQGKRGPKPESQDAVVAWLTDYLNAPGRHTVAAVKRDGNARFARSTFKRAFDHALEQDLVREYPDGGEPCLGTGLQNLKVCS